VNSHLRAVLMARLRAMGASQADAEDCVQEALVEGWTRTRAGDRTGDRLAWLVVVARNKYVDSVRRRARETSVGLVPTEAADRVAEGPEEQVVGRAHARFLASRLRRLPPVTQEVCHLAGRGVDRSTLAGSLGLTLRSAESHLTRARRLLRTHGALGWVALLVATVAATLRRVLDPRLVAKATVAAVSAGVVLMPVADKIHPPAGPTIAAPPAATAPSTRDDQPPPPAAVPAPSPSWETRPAGRPGSEQPGPPPDAGTVEQRPRAVARRHPVAGQGKRARGHPCQRAGRGAAGLGDGTHARIGHGLVQGGGDGAARPVIVALFRARWRSAKVACREGCAAGREASR
jgi:RNA polymerase sigma factor (sigma-70 family)